jgi:hypothetical protein
MLENNKKKDIYFFPPSRKIIADQFGFALISIPTALFRSPQSIPPQI